LKPYNPGDLTVLVGHSFTASFALYAHAAAPDAFDAVIALSPLHLVDRSIPRVVEHLIDHPNERVLVAVGGAQRLKDGGHHADLTAAVTAADASRAQGRFLFKEYPSAGHTSLPLIAFPELLSTLFLPYALRDTLAAVDRNYKLVAPPPAPEELLRELERSRGFLGSSLPWDLAEANGLLSRLEGSGYMHHVILLLRRAIDLYPNEYFFHAWLGQALLERDPAAARASLLKARDVQDRFARDEPDYEEMKAEIEGMLK
jgi:hypothetical protein